MISINSEIESYLRQLLGEQFSSFINAEPEKSAIRINPLKAKKEEVLRQLNHWHVDFLPHPINPDGLIINQDHIPLSHTLLFFTGAIAYQGIASQLPVLALEPQPGETVLDMAASPGSKSTQIAALMKNQGLLVVNDVSTNRMQPLIANLLRCGVMNDVTLNLAGQRLGTLLPEFFDRVLIDAPCTSLGTFHENSRDLNRWWSRQALKKFSNVQRLLLISAIKAAKVGGVIVYSTCSLAPEENEMLIDEILKNYPVKLEDIPFTQDENVFPGFLEYNGKKFSPELHKCCRTLPQKSGMEGFFIARLRKIDSLKKNQQIEPEWIELKSSQDEEIEPILKKICEFWGLDLAALSKYKFIINKNRLWVINSRLEKIPGNNFVKAGLVLAEKRVPHWKLTNASVQIFSPSHQERLLNLSDDELIELFAKSQIDGSGHREGYFALIKNERAIAVLSNFNGRMQIHLPHRFRLIL